ncbi:hypothetical protein [Candidatus Kuenenia stuttgartiensis]|uniref:Anthranilate synthase component I N-terminal domain-containing protein n=1 Tax=Kuenenia stuttgartiensis TaxID=174633 RepID=A0A2C9CEN4_KUEST|nr:hypothetical protein KSMBR1_1549 [Candidatus Kuenenia stuttgartiensis]
MRSSGSVLPVFKKPKCFLPDSALPTVRFQGIPSLVLARFNNKNETPKILIKDKDGSQECEGSPFEYLRKILNRYSLGNISNSLPFQGGAVGYFGYDLCHYIEKLPKTLWVTLNCLIYIWGFTILLSPMIIFLKSSLW